MNPVLMNAATNGSRYLLQQEDISQLESLVMESHGIPKMVSASMFEHFSENQRMLLMVKHGLYVFPTFELANFIDDQVFGRTTLEIGAGNGVMSDYLGTKATDNYSQSDDYRPEPKLAALWHQGRAAMLSTKQAFVTYGSNVERIEAMDSVIKYKPEIVFGSYITHKYKAGDKDGNKFGPDEEKIIRRCDYLMVGNVKTHQNKRILKLPHEEFIIPGVVTRSFDQELNRIWLWKKTDK